MNAHYHLGCKKLLTIIIHIHCLSVDGGVERGGDSRETVNMNNTAESLIAS